MKNIKESDETVRWFTYSFFNLGCPKNLVDAERVAGKLEIMGWVAAADPAAADLLVITTCAFISIAEEESVNEILRVVAHKRKEQILAVLGCLVTREGKKLEELIPEVDIFLPVRDMELLAERADEHIAATGTGKHRKEAVRPANENGEMLSGGRRLFTPHHLAYLKIAEGCSNHCTYCMIPDIRGELESRPDSDIVAEAVRLIAAGVKELVIIAQDTTAYGTDSGDRDGLYTLLREIAGAGGPEWIRLMYMHPAHIRTERIRKLVNEGIIIPYLDIPIQHVSDRVLRKMRRGYGKGELEEIIGSLRRDNPDMVLRTTIMAGFPGESDQEFQELIDFLEEYKFDHVGVFSYSPEKGTKASEYKPVIPESVVQARVDEIIAVQMDISHERLLSRAGEKLTVLVDEKLAGEDQPFPGIWGTGRFYGQAHEIDGITYLSGKELEPGMFAEVFVEEAEAYDLFAVAR